MSSRNQQRSRRPRANNLSKNRLENKQLQVLSHIEMSEKSQQRDMPPSVPDQIPIQIKRDKVHTFERSLSIGSITPSTTLDVFGSASFSLSSLPDSSEFTTLYDQFRIKQVTVTFFPLTTGPYAQPLITVLDYDDAATPTTIASLLEYNTKNMTQGGTIVNRTLEPRFALNAYTGAFGGFAQSLPDQWVDVASSTVQYYGVKWGIAAQTGGTTTPIYAIYAKYIVQCRNQR